MNCQRAWVGGCEPGWGRGDERASGSEGETPRESCVMGLSDKKEWNREFSPLVLMQYEGRILLRYQISYISEKEESNAFTRNP